ncbi:MAG: glycerophosphodiester phosphodiesterase [Hyphomicrobiaceae bacterium]
MNAVAAVGKELHGHRGARGLAPENTLMSFKKAIDLGADCIETDVGMSRDGDLVLHHDRTLNPDIARSGGEWIGQRTAIQSLTMSEIRGFDVGRIRPGTAYAGRFSRQEPRDGAAIPVLQDLLQMPEFSANSDLCLNIEIKTSPHAADETAPPERIADALLKLIREHKLAARVRVQSFDWRNLVHLHKTAPDIALSFLTVEQSWLDNVERSQRGPSAWFAGGDLDAFDGSLPRLIKHLGGDYWAPYYRELTAEQVKVAHGLMLKVIVWTVNSRSAMDEMLEMGVDGIITDYPDIGRRALDEYQNANQ